MHKFEVLVQKNGRIEWMPVPGCINHSEARAQGEAMYAGKIIQTRFLGVENEKKESSGSSSSWFSGSGDSEGGFALAVIALGAIIVISMWPLFLVGGIAYLGYKLYQKNKNESNS